MNAHLQEEVLVDFTTKLQSRVVSKIVDYNLNYS